MITGEPMEDVKFKIWDNDKKEFIRYFIINSDGDVYRFGLPIPGREYNFEHIQNAVKLRYIGSKDKAGKEIYEGHLLQHNANIYEVKYFDEISAFLLVEIHSDNHLWRDGRWLKRVGKYISIVDSVQEKPKE